MVLLCLETTTGPRTAGSLAPHCMGKGSTPDWPGYDVKMIFEVFETLARRGASTLVAGCSYCWLTASTDCTDSAAAALSCVSVPLTASVAASSFNCLIPASIFTRPLILSTAAARCEFSSRIALSPSKMSLRTASCVDMLDLMDLMDLKDLMLYTRLDRGLTEQSYETASRCSARGYRAKLRGTPTGHGCGERWGTISSGHTREADAN